MFARTALIAIPVCLAACAGQGGVATQAGGELTCARTEISIAFISEADPDSRRRIEASARLLSDVLATPEFRERCDAAQMNRTRGRSVQEVCRQLSCSGAQTLRVGLYRDEEMRTLAFEKKGAVFINEAKARAGTPANLAHEFAHVLGYSHQSFWGIWREKSPPYVLGELVDVLTGEQ